MVKATEKIYNNFVYLGMKYSFFIHFALFLSSSGTSSDTTEAQQYEYQAQKGFYNSPLDTNGGIRNTSSFRSDKNRYYGNPYGTFAKEYNYGLRQGKKKDTYGLSQGKKKDTLSVKTKYNLDKKKE